MNLLKPRKKSFLKRSRKILTQKKKKKNENFAEEQKQNATSTLV